MLINEIKMRGFEKTKSEIDERLRIKKQLEVTVESLTKKTNFLHTQKKHYGTKNSKFESEIRLYNGLSEVKLYFSYK
jgi:hypothetical protein